ncbi:MAG: GDP-mannose 4,6-dehydratase [Candidatus Ancaeobacter aquaticus]|nr:GDP-mannose 4,6-dehydratase [Candidatus Ancaeobacter aquaticus]
MNILVTGGAGFIGSHLVERCIAEGHRVICVDNFDTFYDPKIKEKNLSNVINHDMFTLYRDDIRDAKRMDTIFSNTKPDIVIHLAARAGVRPSIKDPLIYEDVNLKGTMNILECVRKYKVKKMIFSSSSSVYGSRTNIPFKEDEFAQKPISPYAATKMAGEMLCYTYHHLYQIPIICLRLFTVYGPRQRPEMAIHKFTRALLSNEEITLYGDGASARDYTFVSDIVSGIVASIEVECNYEIMNLGDSETVKLSTLIELIQKNCGCNGKITYLGNQPGDVPVTCASIECATKVLKYKPKVNIAEGIEKFVQWYKSEFDING